METVWHLVAQAKTAEGLVGTKVQPTVSTKAVISTLQPTGQMQTHTSFCPGPKLYIYLLNHLFIYLKIKYIK
jgi:hypothetical protein